MDAAAVREAIQSSDLGDRLRGVNQIRELPAPTAYELLQIAVKDANARVRYAAVSQLTSVGQEDPEATAQLLRECLLNDPEPDVQAAAADSIGGLQLTQLFDELQQVYSSTSEWLVQFSIVSALGELGEPRAMDLLQSALQSDQTLIQTAAVGSLGELGNPEAVPLLKPFVSHPDWQLRYRLAQALGHIKSTETQPLLSQLAQDDMSQVAEAAQASLSA